MTGIDNDGVERALGEKKLMGCVVNFLTAKVPNVGTKGVTVGMFKVPANYVNALGRFFLGLECVIGVVNLFRQGGFARPALTHDQKFSLIQGLTFIGIKGLKVKIKYLTEITRSFPYKIF